MSSGIDRSVETLMSAALAASQVGTWEYDLVQDRLSCDATMAGWYGFSPDDALQGLPLQWARNAIHPEDLARWDAKRAPLLISGGLFIIEYRIIVAGQMRWVLVRGSYEPNAHGEIVRGQGIIIDVTESKQDGYAEGRALFVAEAVPEPTSLDRAADLAIALREAVDEMASGVQVKLRPLVDALLFGIGRAIAATQGANDAGPDRPRRRDRHLN